MKNRRAAMTTMAALGVTPWMGACDPRGASRAGSSRTSEPGWAGDWVGSDVARGHALRDGKWATQQPATAASTTRCAVAIVGGGVAGLAAARALMHAGVDDLRVFELEDEAGGNARGHIMQGQPCPLGAHYLPVPGDNVPRLRDWLQELGLMRLAHGRWQADTRHLCHAPQERLWIDGAWQEGSLAHAAPDSARAKQYAHFARLVDEAGQQIRFALPMSATVWTPAHAALDAQTFAAWLSRHGLDDDALLGYLDYACRDDYGGGIATVSAWAGLHYFASRHGFHAPGSASDADPEDGGVFTWPEGNAFLTRALAAPLGDRLLSAQVVVRVQAHKHEVIVDAWNVREQRMQRTIAKQAIVALPLHVAARVVDAPSSAALKQAAGAVPHAPWLVANLRIKAPLDDREGAAPAWDNVAFSKAGQSDALGYVDASHQSLLPYRGATVLTAYWALGGAHAKAGSNATFEDRAAALNARRAQLLQESWAAWSQGIVDDLRQLHPDLPGKVERVDLMRYGHAMAMPVPGVRSALEALQLHAPRHGPRVHHAHSDLAGYSIFEEAFDVGHRVGEHVAGLMRAPDASA